GIIRAIRDYLGAQSRLASPFMPPPSLSGRPPAVEASSAEGLFSSAAFVPEARERPYPADRSSWSSIADAAAKARETPRRAAGDVTPVGGRDDGLENGFRYIGRALGVFLAFERGDELVLLDQHAAHERYLYNEMMAGRAVSQELLVPVVYEPESEAEDRYIAAATETLAQAGYRLSKEGGAWLLEAAPAMLPEAMTGSVFALLRSRPDPAELLRETVAQSACKAAVKDGDELDETGAIALIEAALSMPEPRCPHGRPIWYRLSRDDLFRAVRRLV
ncbi:MAG TPA: hypothetical protein PLE25_10865, partial [Spirochaetales bacterium]|nr:hypothetical protein [Spirochaetales bacterium]